MMKRRNALMVRWSALVTLLIAGYWTYFFTTQGYVPNAGTAGTSIILPFGDAFPFNLSRWWDILLGICPAVLIYFWNEWKYTDSWQQIPIQVTLWVFIIGLLFGLPYGIAFVIALVLAIFIVGLAIKLFFITVLNIPSAAMKAIRFMLARDKEDKE